MSRDGGRCRYSQRYERHERRADQWRLLWTAGLIEPLDLAQLARMVWGDRMRCSRCEGLMVPIWMADPLRPDAVQGWRCLLCGEATDPVIEANRKKRPLSVKGRPRLPCSIAGEH